MARRNKIEHDLKDPNLSSEEREGLEQQLSDINQLDISPNLAILDACTQGNKNSSACTALTQPAQEAMDGWNSQLNWKISYKEIFPNDGQNMANILQGLDPDSVLLDASITASMNNYNEKNPDDKKSWGQVATRYDTAMALQEAGSALAGIFGSRGVNAELNTPKMITNLKTISADEANAPYLAKGWGAPYDTATQVRTFTTAKDLTFVRVSTESNPRGSWLVRADEIKGMTPSQIQQHLALPKISTQMAEVTVPAGTRMQVGKVAPQAQFGASQSGCVQYELLDRIPGTSFGIPTLFK